MKRLVLAALVALGAQHAPAQEYPNKPIHVVTSAAGGGTDYLARVVVQALGSSNALGQPLVVENRPTILSIETVKKAAPDGYTLLFNAEPLWTMPFLQKVNFDPVKDFVPVALVGKAPTILVVHPSVPASSVAGLIALAKAKPGALNYSTGTVGAASHFAAELFRAMAGIDIVRVNYNGAGPALNAVLGGVTEITFGTAATVPHVKSGRLKGLAVTSAKPSPVFPELPTVAADLPGYEAVSIYGVLVPAGTPGAIVSRLNREIARVLAAPDVQQRFLVAGVEAGGGSAEDFGAAMKAEIDKVSRVIRDAGIKVQ